MDEENNNWWDTSATNIYKLVNQDAHTFKAFNKKIRKKKIQTFK